MVVVFEVAVVSALLHVCLMESPSNTVRVRSASSATTTRVLRDERLEFAVSDRSAGEQVATCCSTHRALQQQSDEQQLAVQGHLAASISIDRCACVEYAIMKGDTPLCVYTRKRCTEINLCRNSYNVVYIM